MKSIAPSNNEIHPPRKFGARNIHESRYQRSLKSKTHFSPFCFSTSNLSQPSTPPVAMTTLRCFSSGMNG